MNKYTLTNKEIEYLKNKKLFLLDMDGTIYNENKLFDGVIDILNNIKKTGNKYIFLTNNSSKSISDYINKLALLGIDSTNEEFFTSTEATIVYLKEKIKYNNELIYVLGTEALKKRLRQSRLNITDTYSENIEIVLIGFDTELNYQKLIDVCNILQKEVIYIATNPDLVCPVSFGFVPDCGSICEMIYTATNKRPLSIGKPRAEMIETVLQKTGIKKEETLIIGDRLYTDIASGINSGVDTACVLTGETTIEDIEKTKFKPTYVLDSIKELQKIFEKEGE